MATFVTGVAWVVAAGGTPEVALSLVHVPVELTGEAAFVAKAEVRRPKAKFTSILDLLMGEADRPGSELHRLEAMEQDILRDVFLGAEDKTRQGYCATARAKGHLKVCFRPSCPVWVEGVPTAGPEHAPKN